MKRKNPLVKSISLLVVAAVLVLLAQFVLKPRFQKEKETEEKGTLLWPDAKREKFLEIHLKNDSEGFALKKNGEKGSEWIGENEPATGKSYDIETGTVDSLISSMLGTKKEDSLKIDAAKSGLEVPRFELRVIYSNDKEKRVDKTLLIGEDSPVDYQSYAKWQKDPEIFLVSKSLRMAIDKKLSDFRNKKVLHYTLADLKSLHVDTKKPFTVELGAAGKWTIDTGKRKLAADSSALSDWINTLSNTRAAGFVAEDKSGLAKFGLAKPVSKISFTTLKGEKTEWIIGQVKGPGKKGATPENHFYATSDKTESIYEMPGPFAAEVAKDYTALRNKRLLQIDKTKVQKITYKSKDLAITLTNTGGAWQATHALKGKAVTGAVQKPAIEKILNSFSVVRAANFVEKSAKDSSLGFGKTKLEFFGAEPTPLASIDVGNKTKPGEYYIWAPGFEDPATSLLAYDELFPQDPNKLIEKKALESPAPVGASSAATKAGQGKIMKLEKTVNSPKDLKKLPAPIVEKGVKYFAIMTFKNGRKLKIVFDSEKAPYTVSNFIHLARNHFYDGVIMHRVIKDFVVQGGDPTGTGRGGPGWMFNNEDNDLKHVRGSVSMAHAGRDTNGSQFFLVLQPQPHLDGLHTVFGHVTDGINELDEIKQGDALATVEVFQEK